MWKFSSDAVRNRVLWVVTLLAFICTLVVLGLASDLSRNYVDIGCSTPRRTAWHVVLSVFTFGWTLYLGIVTGPWFKRAPVPYGWVVLVVNVIFTICWISAAAVYNQDPTDVCMACSGPGSRYDGYTFEVTSGNTVFTYCYKQADGSWGPNYSYYQELEERTVGHLLARASSFRTSLKIADTTITRAVKVGFDSALVFLFFVGAIRLIRLRDKLYQPDAGNTTDPEEMAQTQHTSDIKTANAVAQEVPEF
ncbi:MAG: hypothetical protein GOMPHAMPRED_004139 [Gomphillus americanus]|uniref:MARVEL domain-containing protein n=1 Tax=Gomphillus americanus TaxID=1940652 RepID=A0A8H3FN84_9LECA|nr:MAG: hypothetical protein GOMPHAMPRED_004139 [Gomphillus americanus]